MLIRLAAFAALSLASISASAVTINVDYSATVSIADGTTANTGLKDGQSIKGSFQFNSLTNKVTESELDGYRAPTQTNLTGLTPSLDTAIFHIGTFNYVPGAINSSVGVGLYALNTQPGGLLPGFAPGSTLTSVLLTQLNNVDLSGPGSGSIAGYLSSDLAYTNPTRIASYITSITASVPEPGAVGLLGIALAGVALANRRSVARSM